MPIETIDSHTYVQYLHMEGMVQHALAQVGHALNNERWDKGDLDAALEQLTRTRRWLHRATAVVEAQKLAVQLGCNIDVRREV